MLSPAPLLFRRAPGIAFARMRSWLTVRVALPFPAYVGHVFEPLRRVPIGRVERPSHPGDRGMGRSVARGILAHLKVIGADDYLTPFVAGLSG